MRVIFLKTNFGSRFIQNKRKMEVFKRKIYNRLLDWKSTVNGTKALLVEGARRIGKSTIVEEFAKNEYKSYTKDLHILSCVSPATSI